MISPMYTEFLPSYFVCLRFSAWARPPNKHRNSAGRSLEGKKIKYWLSSNFLLYFYGPFGLDWKCWFTVSTFRQLSIALFGRLAGVMPVAYFSRAGFCFYICFDISRSQTANKRDGKRRPVARHHASDVKPRTSRWKTCPLAKKSGLTSVRLIRRA